MLVGRDIFHSNVVQIFDCCPQADSARHVRCTRLEFVRNLVVDRLLEGDRTDHVPAALIWRHGFQQGSLSVQDTDSGRSVCLVPGESVEIAVNLLYIDRQTRGRLSTIDQHGYISRVRYLCDCRDRIQAA